MDKPLTSSTVSFKNGRVARVVTVHPEIEAAQIIDSLQLSSTQAVLVLNGGAGNLDKTVSKKLVRLFDGLAEFVIKNKITVVTGGTKSGVFAIFGQALAALGGATAPCIGVSITGHDVLNRLEPNHTDFVLVEASDWGMETAMMYCLVEMLSKGRKSLAVFAGGGAHSLKEMEWNIQQKREMVFIAGSKGYTDAVLNMKPETVEVWQKFKKIQQEGNITLFDLKKSGVTFVDLLSEKIRISNESVG